MYFGRTQYVYSCSYVRASQTLSIQEQRTTRLICIKLTAKITSWDVDESFIFWDQKVNVQGHGGIKCA